jgi:hypothetical protein
MHHPRWYVLYLEQYMIAGWGSKMDMIVGWGSKMDSHCHQATNHREAERS